MHAAAAIALDFGQEARGQLAPILSRLPSTKLREDLCPFQHPHLSLVVAYRR